MSFFTVLIPFQAIPVDAPYRPSGPVSCSALTVQLTVDNGPWLAGRSTGLLALCEVALGEAMELEQADYDAASKLIFKNSTKGVGRSAPTASEPLPDGACSVPMGPVATSERTGLALQYNEYIVYHPDQVRMRYLVRVKFNFKHR